MEKDHLCLLKEEVLPRFKETRSNLENHLFERYLIGGEPIKDMAKDKTILQELGNVSNPSKALHNRVQTMLWNVYKAVKREESRAESSEYRNVLLVWMG